MFRVMTVMFLRVLSFTLPRLTCSVIPVVIHAFDHMVWGLFVLFARARIPAKRVMCEDLGEE